MALTARELLTKAFHPDTSADALSCEADFARHLQLHPQDTNFIATLSKPGEGYGHVVCMETDCFTDIQLTPHPIEPRGGIERGFGCLIAYSDHIMKEERHKASRDERLKKEAIVKSEAPPKSWTPKIKTSASQPSSDAEGSHSRDDEGLPHPSSSAPRSSGVKSGASSGSGAKKRKSEELKPRSSAGDVFADKKPKIGDAARLPKAKPVESSVLADRKNKASPPAAANANAGAADGSALSPDEERDLAKNKRAIDRWETTVKALGAEPAVMHDAAWREEMAEAERELKPLRTKVHAYEQRIAAAAAAKAVSSAAAALAKAAPARKQPDLFGGGYTCSADAPLSVRNNFLLRFAWAAAAYPEWVQPTNGPVAGPSGERAGPAFPELAGAGAGAQAPRGMGALGGLGAANPGDGDAGGDSDEERMWDQLAPVQGIADFDHFVKAALEGEGFEGNANVQKACEVIGIAHMGEMVPHMTCTLLPHQIIACAWTKDQERSKAYGGIIGDEMGLGKTIEAIATCLLNESRDSKEKTTLVVAPLALLAQWRAELEEKVEPGYLSILTYHGADRKKLRKKDLLRYDFVLTTYGTLVADFEDDEALEKTAKREAKKAGEPQAWESYLKASKGTGPLFELSFYRIILDEAQQIRNRGTKVSRAVTRLDALFRWALTGTPVTNSLADLFGIFRFLQLKPWYEWKRYSDSVVSYEKKQPDVAGRKAQAILRTCMLRRKKDSKLDGKELISLKEKHINLHELEFSVEEREIYEMIETRAQEKFNKFLKAGTVMKNYANVLLLLLRLRQVCFHPALIIDAEQTLASKEAAKQKVKDELVRAKKELGAPFVSKIRSSRLEAAVDRVKTESEGKGAESATNDDCPLCLEDILASENGASISRCGHSFCALCIMAVIEEPVVDDQDDEAPGKRCKPDQRPCPICRRPVGIKDLFDLAAFEPTDEEICTATGQDLVMGDDDVDESLGGFIVPDGEEDDDEFGKAVLKRKPKQPNRAIVQDSDDDDDQVAQQSEAEEEPAPASDKGKGKKKVKTAEEIRWVREQEPSTKMLWAMAELRRMFEENPEEKVIIISSFVAGLDILDTYLESQGVRTLRYQGDMSISDRDETLRTFRKSKKRKVLLLSLKCGGVGLTLTRANRVISLDLAWSSAVESQAFDRVHRIGQSREVHVNRLTIAKTVEQRILDMQKRKQGLADASMGEGSAVKMGKLTVADLAGLFGLNMRGERV
ncbi:hypothetical protein JCM9279_003196 [Rhodotorula babjevae]